jgi:hypothetical protein
MRHLTARAAIKKDLRRSEPEKNPSLVSGMHSRAKVKQLQRPRRKGEKNNMSNGPGIVSFNGLSAVTSMVTMASGSFGAVGTNSGVSTSLQVPTQGTNANGPVPPEMKNWNSTQTNLVNSLTSAINPGSCVYQYKL